MDSNKVSDVQMYAGRRSSQHSQQTARTLLSKSPRQKEKALPTYNGEALHTQCMGIASKDLSPRPKKSCHSWHRQSRLASMKSSWQC